ncbi:hypothetical protein EII17_10410 [Clostridiales bacterium COT073_COT-073]|nr:hypothetical protein EII17_10410 [Clostridiales bacterium COT073_COT-073]
MDDKKLKILKMVEDKIITVEEAMNLLALLDKQVEKKQSEIEKTERKQKEREQKALIKRIKEEARVKKEEMKHLKHQVNGEFKQAEIIKLSENEFEILPREQKPGGKLQKKGWFGGKLFGGGRKLIIRVEEKSKAVVNLRLPLGFVVPFIKGGLKIGQMNSPEFNKYMSQVSPEELEQYINSGYVGPLIDIHDEDGDEHVYIGIE